jgi:hypothetical protein
VQTDATAWRFFHLYGGEQPLVLPRSDRGVACSGDAEPSAVWTPWSRTNSSAVMPVEVL